MKFHILFEFQTKPFSNSNHNFNKFRIIWFQNWYHLEFQVPFWITSFNSYLHKSIHFNFIEYEFFSLIHCLWVLSCDWLFPWLLPLTPGWYCSGNSSSDMTTTEGGECQPGTFCPEASYAPTSCTPGMYCQTAGLDAPTGNCTDGKTCSILSYMSHWIYTLTFIISNKEKRVCLSKTCT